MIQNNNSSYVTQFILELRAKSHFTLETDTHAQTLCVDFDNDCNQSGFLSLSADGDCNLSNLDRLDVTGLGD